MTCLLSSNHAKLDSSLDSFPGFSFLINSFEAVALGRDPLPDIGWQAWGMEWRGIHTAAGDLWRKAHGR